MHPLWWSALGLLLLNDHVLKHARVLPEIVTGKLSDVAGMLVAPALLALLFGARRPLARALSTLLVGLMLCAVNLSPAAAHALERLLCAIGIASRIWVDKSDLWALLVLPAGYLLCEPRPLSRRARVLSSRCGIALGAAACLATSATHDDKTRSDAPMFENGSGETIALRADIE